MRTILFDLDGTLLPMNQNVFVNDYFRRMAAYCAPYGFDSEQLVKDIWKGTAAMVANDGTMTNEERFWQVFHALTGRGNEADRKLFLSFYVTEFDAVKEVCGYNPEAEKLIRDLKERGDDLILATNPLFPRTATLRRVGWAGLSPDDFRMITTYEMMNTCKPNPEYFRELCRKADLVPEECVLIGNDAVEDVAAAETGMQVFLITDCLENGTEDTLAVPNGSFADARSWLGL